MDSESAGRAKANMPIFPIAGLPERLGFPLESPRLSKIEDELWDETYKSSPRGATRIRELSLNYEQAAAALIKDWQPMRLKPAIVGAFIAKANLFGHLGYENYQKDALEQAAVFAEKMNLERIVEVIEDELDMFKSYEEEM